MVAAALLSGCTGQGEQPAQVSNASGDAETIGPDANATGWDLQSSGDEVSLVLGPGAEAAIRLICPAGGGRLLVNVPSFRPIGSEERLSVGSGEDVVALVADTRGDSDRGGVSGAAATPDNLEALVAGPISASYGAQTSGPHQAVPSQLVETFVAACSGSGSPQAPPVSDAGACRIQDGREIPANRLKAIGTEPFWGADINGRCVTYSTPEDQKGTRVWTRFSGTAERGAWAGYLDNQRFTLRTRPDDGCSDGMSDRRYPIAVTLTVRGEERNGCADRPW